MTDNDHSTQNPLNGFLGIALQSLTRFRVSGSLCITVPNTWMMPQISVSDTLYRQLEEATDDCDTEDAMWEMVYLYNRGNNPSE